jgi:hypothetical protein
MQYPRIFRWGMTYIRFPPGDFPNARQSAEFCTPAFSRTGRNINKKILYDNIDLSDSIMNPNGEVWSWDSGRTQNIVLLRRVMPDSNFPSQYYAKGLRVCKGF